MNKQALEQMLKDMCQLDLDTTMTTLPSKTLDSELHLDCHAEDLV